MRFLVLFAIIVGVAVASPTDKDRKTPLTPEQRACKDFFRLSDAEKAEMKSICEKCVESTPGLKTLIDKLKATEGNRSAIYLLENTGHQKEALELRQCKAQGQGNLITSSSGVKSFDVTGFKNKIRSKAAKTSHEAAVNLGLTNCPTNSLTSYDIRKYMRCIKDYCSGKLH